MSEISNSKAFKGRLEKCVFNLFEKLALVVNGMASGAKNHVSAFLPVFTLLKEQLQALVWSDPLRK